MWDDSRACSWEAPRKTIYSEEFLCTWRGPCHRLTLQESVQEMWDNVALAQGQRQLEEAAGAMSGGPWKGHR